MIFNYTAETEDGRQITGTVEAELQDGLRAVFAEARKLLAVEYGEGEVTVTEISYAH